MQVGDWIRTDFKKYRNTLGVIRKIHKDKMVDVDLIVNEMNKIVPIIIGMEFLRLELKG